MIVKSKIVYEFSFSEMNFPIERIIVDILLNQKSFFNPSNLFKQFLNTSRSLFFFLYLVLSVCMSFNLLLFIYRPLFACIAVYMSVYSLFCFCFSNFTYICVRLSIYLVFVYLFFIFLSYILFSFSKYHKSSNVKEMRGQKT